jgi:hypothetical protein
MTYNFDPDRWYENELAIIHSTYKAGEMTMQEYEKAVDVLDRKYKEMWKRLDGSYQIPKQDESCR